MKVITDLLADPTVMAAVAAIAAFAAVPISLLALISSHKTSRKMVEIEQARDKAAERQAGKAILTGFQAPASRNDYKLTVRNEGSGTARAIKVWIDGKPASESPVVREPLPDGGLLSPRGTLTWHLVPSHGNPLPKKIRIEWDDESGEPGVHESGL